MATWITHLRVAEFVLKSSGIQLDETAYYIGSIAPDSGKMIDNFTYVPTKDVSHWKRDDVSYEQRFEDNAEFFKKYAQNETDLIAKSFYLGYYVHILTDTMFVRDVIHPFMREHGYDYWRENILTIRAGWYEIDYRFIARNPDFYPFALLKTVDEFPNTYLDYFDVGDFTERIHNCVEIFSDSEIHPEQFFLTIDEEKHSKMLLYMTDTIMDILKNRHNLI